MKFTQIPTNTFQNIQLNAGILLKNFDPATGSFNPSDIIGATSGGNSFKATPTYEDFGDDIDNCPKNTMELNRLTSWDVTMDGSFVTVNTNSAKMLIGAADIDELDSTKVVPRRDVQLSDYDELWWVGDYSDVNTGEGAGFCAIHMINTLSTGGFQLQTTDKGKGTFAFTFKAHTSMAEQDKVPFDIYIKGGGEALPSILLNMHSVTIEVDDTVTLTASTIPSDATVTWSSSASGKASVTSGGVVEGESAGSAIITASITVEGVSYTDTCTVIVTAAE